MRAPKYLIVGGFTIWMAIGRGFASPSDFAIRPVDQAPAAASFSFQVDSSGLSIASDAQGAAFTLPGFDTVPARAGEPELPRKTVLVAIPPGVTPRLEFRATEEILEPAVRPKAGERETVELLVEGDDEAAAPADAGRAVFQERPGGRQVSVRHDRIEDSSIFAGETVWPAAPVSLGKIGVLRGQRYVEVLLAPVQFDPELSGVRVAKSLEVTIHFDGDSGRRWTSEPERIFDDTYRGAFLNYAQGATFRLNAPHAATLEASAPSPMAATATGTDPYRIRVRQNGLVRIDASRIAGTPYAGADVATWKVTSRGVEVALQVHDDGNGIIGPGDWVQFYGQALDDEPKTVLNLEVPNTLEDLYEARDFTDENIYFLTIEPGSRSRVTARPSAPTFVRVPPVDFLAVAHVETDNAFRPLGGVDPWFSLPTVCYSGCGGLNNRTEIVPLPGLHLGTDPLQVIARLRGSTESAAVNPDHKTSITLQNGATQTLAINNDDGTFDGRTIYTHDFPWTYPGSGPQASDPVKVRLDVLNSGATNQVIVDWVEVRYRRTFTAVADTLRFDWPDGDAEFIVTGLQSSAPIVYDITSFIGSSGTVQPVQLTGGVVTGAGPYTIRFRVDEDPAIANGTPRRFLVAGDAAASVPAPADFSVDTVSDLRSTAIQADLIVLAHPSVLDTSPGGPLSLLLARRASQGISSKIVLLQDVQDEFNDGLPGPLAIENFLRWVLSSQPGEGWASPKPTYVMILGDASYDYKGGLPSGDFVPTQLMFKDQPEIGHYASDNLMAAVLGSDDRPDLVVGRISGRTIAETNLMLQKTLDHEQNPTAGNWLRHALFISDRGEGINHQAESLEFEAVNALALSFVGSPFSTRNLRYYSDFGGTDAAGINTAILDSVNGFDGFSNGAALVQYIGHGNYELWSNDAFFDDSQPLRDTDLLTNGGRHPWLLAHNCLTGGFHTPAHYTMGEDWIKRPGGGAVAVLAPSGLSFVYVAERVTQTVWTDLYGPRKERSIAVPVMDTLTDLCSLPSPEFCQHTILLGDPSLTLALRSVAPATSPLATGSNMRVDLSWTASTTPGVTYDVYRGDALIPPNYLPVATNVPGTTFADLTVVNAKRYYYYVVARDAQSFQSRWSNFNSDCAVSGPDCVSATPLNPNAPFPPIDVSVSDPESGSRLVVSWTANLEPDIKSYTVWSGPQPGDYTNNVVVPKSALSTTVFGLTNGVPHYFAVTATNTSNLVSGFSQEASGIPTLVRGVKSPAFIRSLRVNKSGGNAVLTWAPVTTDIYGKPLTTAFYEVFRGTTPNFIPTMGNRIGFPTAPTLTDTGAFLVPDTYHYLVRAVDGQGNVGGLGSQLPTGIDALRVDPSPVNPGRVVLSWPAVTLTFDEDPTSIVRYNVYAAGQPFARDDIRNGTIPQITTSVGTSIEITPSPANQYYSVLAVDTRGNLSPY